MSPVNPSTLIRHPAAERNKGPILKILQNIFAETSKEIRNFLEIGSSSGQHIAHFAPEFSQIQFQPSDVDSQLFENIRGFIQAYNLENVNEPYLLDLTKPIDEWIPSSESFDVLYCSNVVHISPWACSIGLFNGAGRVLRPQGLLLLYGPFANNGTLTPESNVQFDQSLRSRNSEWGIRDLKDLKELANQNDLHLQNIFDMPANNKLLFFQKK